MNVDWVFVGVIAFGLALGVAVLPWQHKLSSRDGPLLFVAAIACFWPLFLPLAILHGLRTYRNRWNQYLDHRERLKHTKPQEEKAFPDFPAHETVKKTYFKNKDEG